MKNVVYVKNWFANKIDLGYGKKLESTKATIVKETEKAYLLNVSWYTIDGEYEGYTNVWCPKSCTMTEEEFLEEEKKNAKRLEDGCSRYEKLIKFAKTNGVKGIRKGLKRTTIERKIKEAGLIIDF